MPAVQQAVTKLEINASLWKDLEAVRAKNSTVWRARKVSRDQEVEVARIAMMKIRKMKMIVDVSLTYF